MNIQSLFGTDGIRQQIGVSPLTQQELCHLGYAIGQWIQHRYGSNASLVIAQDTRHSCSFIKASLLSGLLQHPIIIFDAHILPIAGIKVVMNNLQLHCGIMISASHNHYHDNGIKIIDQKNGKITTDEEIIISSLYHQHDQSPLQVNTNFGSTQFLPHATELYLSTLKNYFPPHFMKGKKIVLDLANGALYQSAPIIFASLGAEVISINTTPNGKNINAQCGTLFPASLLNAIQQNNADIGFGFDGDGDRIIVGTNKGEIKNGDDILFLLAQHKNYIHEKIIVGTVMSNEGLIHALQKINKQCIRTHVGEKWIAQELAQQHLLLGGEPSGHIIMNDYLTIADGLFAALRVMELLIDTKNWDFTTFIKYPQITTNMLIQSKKNIDIPPFSSIIDFYQKKLDHGRILVRYSGTEPLLRITIEHTNEHEAKKIAQQLIIDLKKELSS